MSILVGSTSFNSLRAIALRHHLLLLNAGAVALATIANGALGFVYWWVAARFYEVSAVGLASAAISIISLICLVGDLGLSTLLAGESQRRPTDAPHLISAAVLASLTITGALGLAYIVAVLLYAHAFRGEAINPPIHILIAIGASMQAATFVLDSSLIGTFNSGLRLYRNLLFGGLKLLLIGLPVIVAIASGIQATYIVATWAIAQPLSLVGLAIVARRRGHRVWYRPDFSLLRGLFSQALWHYAINVVASTPGLLMPVIISSFVSVEQTGPFWLAWTLLQMASIVPAALSTVLYTVCSADMSQLGPRLRLSLSISALIGIGAAGGFYFLSGSFLALLNPAYPRLVGSDLVYLGFCVVLLAVKMHYVAIERIYGQLPRCALTLCIFSLIEVGSAALGASMGALPGLVAGWLLAMSFEAIVLLPLIIRRLISALKLAP